MAYKGYVIYLKEVEHTIPFAKEAFGVGQESENSVAQDSRCMFSKTNQVIPSALAMKRSPMASFFDFLIRVVFAGQMSRVCRRMQTLLPQIFGE